MNYFESENLIYCELTNCNSLNRTYLYRVKYKDNFVFISVNCNTEFPLIEDFIVAIKEQCHINSNAHVEISDEQGCKITSNIVFGHILRYVYKENNFFVVRVTEEERERNEDVVAVADIPRIYENPDKFFIYFLSKDLVYYFKIQTTIISEPSSDALIQKYHTLRNENLVQAEKNTIIQISANHLMLVKNNEPSKQDKILWAKVICEVFVQFRNNNSPTEYYWAVYNPSKGDGFLGNRIKLLKKIAKKVEERKLFIEKVNTISTEPEPSVKDLIELSDNEHFVELLKTSDISKDLPMIRDYHKRTFLIRQNYRRLNHIDKLISEFPRFFDVEGLIDEDFAELYPLSGLITFTQEIQQKIIKISKSSHIYARFPSTYKNFAEPIDALLHLILILPPQVSGRGCKNRTKIEDAFQLLLKIHEVNEPLSAVKNNPDNTPFIVVSGLPDNAYKLYYVKFDSRFIKCESAIRAIDILIKVHYVFNLEFNSNVRFVLGFIAYYIYNIKNVQPTAPMILLQNKLN